MVSKIEAIIKRSPVGLLLSRHRKHSDMYLYSVLTDCLEICEICERDPGEMQVLNRLITELPLVNGTNRVYVEAASDIYQRTCRFMLHGEEHTANVNRYAICLREAAKRGVTSATLLLELNRGGVSKFFLQRPGQGRSVSTKCLRLDRAIYHHKGSLITLQLKRNPDGLYEVLAIDEKRG